MLIDLYSVGFVVAFMITMHRLSEDGKVTLLDIIWSTFVGVFSWIGVLALLLGSVLRRNGESYLEANEDEQSENNNS